jgi:hypothetical protein
MMCLLKTCLQVCGACMLSALSAGGAWLLLQLLLVAGHQPQLCVCMASSRQTVSMVGDSLRSPRIMRGHCSRGVCRVSQHGLVKRGPPALAPLHRHTAAPVQLCASRGLRHACFRTAQLLCGSPVQQLCWLGASGVVWSCASFKQVSCSRLCLISADTLRAATATAQQLDSTGNRWPWTGETCALTVSACCTTCCFTLARAGFSGSTAGC